MGSSTFPGHVFTWVYFNDTLQTRFMLRFVQLLNSHNQCGFTMEYGQHKAVTNSTQNCKEFTFNAGPLWSPPYGICNLRFCTLFFQSVQSMNIDDVICIFSSMCCILTQKHTQASIHTNMEIHEVAYVIDQQTV